ncbi:MAG TPA: DUF3037 domain-containing protein [Terriglobales bacterium]|nr:DUF3037 domain-containing protein [Terriglobales bacterium]
MSGELNSCSYAVLRYITDPKRDLSIPIGVALWTEKGKWVRARFAQPNEALAQLTPADYAFIHLVSRDVESWIKTGRLPYQEKEMSPMSDDWWRHLQQVLIHKTRLSEPRSIECRDPQRELDTLFAFIVSDGSLVAQGEPVFMSHLRKASTAPASQPGVTVVSLDTALLRHFKAGMISTKGLTSTPIHQGKYCLLCSSAAKLSKPIVGSFGRQTSLPMPNEEKLQQTIPHVSKNGMDQKIVVGAGA